MQTTGEKCRKRGGNYSHLERATLLGLSNKYKAIIENKKTDAVTWKQTEDAWNKIAVEFCANTDGLPRTAKQLKTKYEGIKKDLKKQQCDFKKYQSGTGGGGPLVYPKIQTEEEKELLNTIALSVEGLTSDFDSDALAGVSGIYVDIVVPDVAKYTNIDWFETSAGFLQIPLRPALKPTCSHKEKPSTLSYINTQNITDHDYSFQPKNMIMQDPPKKKGNTKQQHDEIRNFQSDKRYIIMNVSTCIVIMF